MKISKGKQVKVEYQLRLESFDGELVEETTKDKPETFIVGDNSMLDVFENQLLDKEAGDEFKIKIEPQDAFGEYDPEALIEFSEEEFYELVGEDKGDFELGAYFPMEDEDGNQYDGFITEMEEDRIVIDFNHPLSGETLFFTGKILDVSDAKA